LRFLFFLRAIHIFQTLFFFFQQDLAI
jgi:hypothetical protein